MIKLKLPASLAVISTSGIFAGVFVILFGLGLSEWGGAR